jgi:hypothetical protein
MDILVSWIAQQPTIAYVTKHEVIVIIHGHSSELD